MRWLHLLVLVVLGVAVTVTNGHPLEKDEQTSLEESFADGEETVVDNGKKKSSLDSDFEKDDKSDSKEVINNDSRIEKLIDDISDSKSADTTERDFQTKIEDFAAHGSGCRSDIGCGQGVVKTDKSSLYSVLEDKKDEVNNADAEEQTGEKKMSIAKSEDEHNNEVTETVKQTPIKFERKEDIDEPEEDKKEAEVTDYDEEATPDDVSKKDEVKPATPKVESAKVAPKEAKETSTGSSSGKKREEHHHRHQLEKKTTAHKKGEDNAKKWWMVEGPHKWGGLGHSHWGPPHHTETENEHHDEGHEHGAEDEGGDEGGHGESKSHVPACCRSKDHNVRKRCACTAHEEGHKEGEHHHVKEHEDGYHFHDKGGTHGHNDHDHDLRGPWSFGYDGFGDDWGDWDHNHGHYRHLKKLEEDSHGGHQEYHDGDHEGHGEHDDHGDCSSRRDCISDAVEEEPVEASLQPPLVAPVVAPVAGPLSGALSVPAPLSGAAPLSVGPADYGAPVALVALPPPPVAHGHTLPYRVCHSCHLLRDGGSRCLCKALRHHHGHPAHEAHVSHPGHVHHANTHFNHHVYIDCDAAVHNFPHKEHLCFPRHRIPTPERVKQATGGTS